jgi:thiol-disulfide isomerase/thioredoxin
MHRTISRRTPVFVAAISAMLSAILAHPVYGQVTPRATTPVTARSAAACLDSVAAYERNAMETREQTKMSYSQIAVAKRAKAHDCVTVFGKKPRLVRDGPALARLQLIAGDTSAAVATVIRYLLLPAARDSIRAERYVAAIPLLISSRIDSSFIRANALTAQLDSMLGASTTTKVIGHGGMLTYYRAIDNDDQMEAHASRIISLAPSLDSASRQRASRLIILAYTAMAEVYGDRADEKNAVKLLSDGLDALADLPDAAPRLSEVRDRYRLVGTKGVSLVARYWLNGDSLPQEGVVHGVAVTHDTALLNVAVLDSAKHDSVAHDNVSRDTAVHDTSAHGNTSTHDSTTIYDPAGHVTLVQFTAHWCGPCRKSYPAVERLQAKYAARDYHTVFVTNLYGFMGDHEGLTSQEELDADREYFVNTHDLTFPIGIAVSADSQPGNIDANALHYKVGGIPHIAVLDHHGSIRMIVIGWDPTSEARLDAMIAALLDEKIVSR